MDPSAGPGRYGHPPAVGPLELADRGRSVLLEPGEGDQSALVQCEAGDGGDARGYVAPARGFPGREPGVAGEGQGAVGCRAPDGDGVRAQRSEGVRQEGLGHRLGVVGGGQYPAFGRAEPHGDRGGLGRFRRAGAPGERGGDLADVVAGSLVDDVGGEFERGQPGLAGQVVELAGRRGGVQLSCPIRMPLASSIRALPSAAACAARTSRRSRSTVATRRPRGVGAGCGAGFEDGSSPAVPGAVPAAVPGAVPAAVTGTVPAPVPCGRASSWRRVPGVIR